MSCCFSEPPDASFTPRSPSSFHSATVDVGGDQRQDVRLLLAEVLHEGVVVVGEQVGEAVADGGVGGAREPGQQGPDAAHGVGDVLVLVLHALDQVGLQADPAQQLRPEQGVLVGVVAVQAVGVALVVLGQQGGAGGVAGPDPAEQVGHHLRLAPEDPVDHDHLLDVRAFVRHALQGGTSHLEMIDQALEAPRTSPTRRAY